MWSCSVVPKEVVQGLLDGDLLNSSSAHHFVYFAHESFYFAIGLWPVWCDLAMMETEVSRELVEVMSIERRSIVCFQDLRGSKCGKDLVEDGDDRFVRCGLSGVSDWCGWCGWMDVD